MKSPLDNLNAGRRRRGRSAVFGLVPVLLLGWSSLVAAHAADNPIPRLTVDPLFGSNMLLQHTEGDMDEDAYVLWGRCGTDDKVSIDLGSQAERAPKIVRSKPDGGLATWGLRIRDLRGALPVGEPLQIVIRSRSVRGRAETNVVFTNVLVGSLWLVGVKSPEDFPPRPRGPWLPVVQENLGLRLGEWSESRAGVISAKWRVATRSTNAWPALGRLPLNFGIALTADRPRWPVGFMLVPEARSRQLTLDQRLPGFQFDVLKAMDIARAQTLEDWQHHTNVFRQLMRDRKREGLPAPNPAPSLPALDLQPRQTMRVLLPGFEALGQLRVQGALVATGQ